MSKAQQQAEANIQTFLRVKPSKNPSGYFSVDELDPFISSDKNKDGEALSFTLPDNFKSDYINNSKLKHSFRFNGVIDAAASQDDVFKKVGVSAVKNAIEGFNSTGNV